MNVESVQDLLFNLVLFDLPRVTKNYHFSNNKFSYTTVSDDALLRNIELFDKLSLKFSGRIVYAKDTTGKSGHICTWCVILYPIFTIFVV